ncbi:MAG TPA: hypothetical protein VIM36_15600 [Gemmatimonadaceae bacterium]
MSDHPAIHQVDQKRREPGLDDVAAEHDDDCSSALFCRRDSVDDAAEIARDENIGK